LVFPAFVFVPVHVVMRKGRLKPAMPAQFFDRIPAVLLKLLDRVRICGVEQLV
jgi:hypothetical protein